jgi:hypothetical protein
VAKNVCALELATTSALQAIFARRALRGMDSEDSGPGPHEKRAQKKTDTDDLERWNDDASIPLAALFLSQILTLKMQSDVEINIASELPFKFPGRNTDLFPNPWPYKDRSGKGMTPRRDSKEWKEIIDFKESPDWETGDLKTFANYFRVSQPALSEKISASMEERRRERMFKYPLQEHRHHGAS